MSTEIAVLRVLLRFSHLGSNRRTKATKSTKATIESIAAHVREDAEDVQRSLGALVRAEWVQRHGDSVRLSFAGFAVAVASAAHAKETANPPHRAPVIPLVRRRCVAA